MVVGYSTGFCRAYYNLDETMRLALHGIGNAPISYPPWHSLMLSCTLPFSTPCILPS